MCCVRIVGRWPVDCDPNWSLSLVSRGKKRHSPYRYGDHFEVEDWLENFLSHWDSGEVFWGLLVWFDWSRGASCSFMQSNGAEIISNSVLFKFN